MDKIQALELMVDLIRHRKSIENRNKQYDGQYDEAYSILHEMVANLPKHDFVLSEELQRSVNEQDLIEYSHIYEDNGFVIKLYIRRKEDEERRIQKDIEAHK